MDLLLEQRLVVSVDHILIQLDTVDLLSSKSMASFVLILHNNDRHVPLLHRNHDHDAYDKLFQVHHKLTQHHRLHEVFPCQNLHL